MFSHFTNTQIISAAVVLVFLVVVAIVGFVHRRGTRTKAFRNRFGSEYDRAVLEHGSSRKAEAKLADRETRVDALKIRELGATERERFVAEWQTVQSRFVDHPKAAVTEADDLIAALLEARGYPKDSFEQRAADVSVNYPRVMEDYRVAHAIARKRRALTTEYFRIGSHIAPRIKLHAQRFNHAILDGAQEAHSNQHEVNIDSELGSGNSFKLRGRRAHADGVQLFHLAVFVAGEARGGNRPIANAAFLVGALGA